MKKRTTAMVAGALAAVMVLGGCATDKGIETEEIVITKYKGVEVELVEKPAEVTDENVDGIIEMLLESQAETVEITDRAVQEGDTVDISYVGRMDGVEFEGGSAESYPLTIGSNTFIEGFEDSVIGHEIGDTYDWNGQFPNPYENNPDFAGKDVIFTITVNGITVQQIPELSDDMVKTLSEQSETVEEYREEVREQLENEASYTYEDTLRTQVWQKVMENTTVNQYPEDEVAEQAGKFIEQYKTAAESGGITYDEFIETQLGLTVEEFEKQVEDMIKEGIKQTMALEAIAKEEKLEMSDEQYEEELQKLADMYGEDVEVLKESIAEEDLRKTIQALIVQDWLAENCIQKAAN